MRWIRNLLGLGRDEEGLPEVEAEEQEEVEGDPFAPAGDRASILARVKLEAEADAIRHAEDMLDRDFPIVAKAEDTAESRLATLRSAYAERRGELAGRIAVLERSARELMARQQMTDQSLVAEGVPQSQVALPPLLGKRTAGEQIAILLGSLVAIAVVVQLLDLRGQWVLPAIGLLVVVLALALFFQPGTPLEDPAVAALRKQRQSQDEALTETQEELQAHHEALTKLETQTYSLVEAEVRFAGEMATEYNSTVFSSLPAGVLAEGRQLREQRRPLVRIPAWATGLTGAE